MPNAAAHFDDDFGLTETARKKPVRGAPASKGATGKKKGKGKAKRFPFNVSAISVARYAAIGMSGAVVLGILVNALMMQTGHHPAPLFGTAIALGPSTKPAPKPVARVEAQAAAPAETAPPAPAAKPHTLAKAEAPSESDAIARLLQGGGVPPADKTDGKAETKTVLGAQRALAKLGFTVKATGTAGPQTKKAIEAFEKDRHLPVKGELSRRVLKVLAAESGIKIEH